MSEIPNWYCHPTPTYAANSTFSHNLQKALASVVANASITSFYDATVGNSSEKAIAMGQCRGDLDGEACQVCLSFAASQITQRCPVNRVAMLFLQGCILHYRYANFTLPQIFVNITQSRNELIPDPQRFMPILTSFFEKQIASAIINPSGRLFWGDKFSYTRNLTIYGTVQCVQYLSPNRCKICLDIVVDLMLKKVAKTQAAVAYHNFECVLRYDTVPFFIPQLPHKIAPSSAVSTNCSPPASSNKVGSPFHRNLMALLSYLIVHAPTSGFYNDSVGLDSSQVYGQVLCRGDVPDDVCWECTAQASTKIQELCPNSRRAIVWLDRCQLRYSDENFAGMMDVYNRACQPAAENASNPTSFDQNLGILISNLTSLATQSSVNRLFATGVSVLAESQRIYALVQCMRDISADQCRWCLQNASSDIVRCSNGKQGGRILRGSCSLAFGVHPFFLGDPTLSLHQHKNGKLKQKEATSVDTENVKENEEVNYDLPQMSLRTIEDATDKFSESNKLGEGGYGPVYKGKLPNGQQVAVKRQSGRSGQGLKEFKNEVELIVKLQHVNLVRLIACSLEKGEKMLIYEYMPNKSLDFFLKDPESRVLLDWEKRFNIIIGIARGILYLHQDSRLNVIHRDLKASNVLLDEQLNPKISDFGLARIFSGVQGQATTSIVVGTYGYMAPEYAMDGVFSTKSDVYSFGILLFEIISGQLNSALISATLQGRGLVENAWSLWCEEKGTEFIDPVLKDAATSTSNQMLRCLHIGFLCIQEDPATRPTMSTVVLMLGNDSVYLPLPKQPAYFGENITDSSQRGSVITSVTSETFYHRSHCGEAMCRTCCSFIFLIALLLPPVLVKTVENPYWICIGGVNLANSTFSHNLQQALASLVANVSLTGYYNVTVGKSPDQVIAAVQCRGDIDGEACEVCVSDAASQVTLRCPRNRVVAVVLQSCFMYVTDPNFTIPRSFMNVSFQTAEAIPDPERFKPMLTSFFNNLIVSATTNPSGRLYWGDSFRYTQNLTVYAMAQCLQNLTPKSCRPCLDEALAIMLKDATDTTSSTVFLNIECGVGYDIFPFFTPPPHKIAPSSAISISTSCFPPSLFDKVSSPFHRNLQALLNNYLIVYAPFPGFYDESVGLGSSQVYGQALCRGDITKDVCWHCIAQASTKIQELCPNSRRATIWLDLCQLRYSDENFAGTVDVQDRACQPSAENTSNPTSFDENLRILFSNLTSKAVQSSPTHFFATGKTLLPDSQTIYALVQCVRDISADQCGWCLRNASGDIEGCFNGRQGGRILRGSCSLSFGMQSFFASDPALVSSVQPNHEKLKQKETTLTDTESAEENETTFDLPQISLRTIQVATDKFSESKKLGEGGYGPVYKGKLPDGQEVAVKRLSGRSRQGLKQFRNEVESMAKLQHTNLVRLIGCCSEKGEKLLIYEYMPNKSLDFILRDPGRRASLDWDKRFNIIIGIARGMLYLHQDSRLNIIHRDLKASNVLLDEQLHPKISDFGLARIFSGVQGHATTSVIVGTYGYMAPEYAMDGVFSTKSDVYSFGILLLEIISGQLNAASFCVTPDESCSLVERAWSLWCEEKGTEFIDPVLKDTTTSTTDQMLRCLQIGLLCIEEVAATRPTMSTVLIMLGNNSLDLPVPTQPAFIMENATDSSRQRSYVFRPVAYEIATW
ncbi:putative L-type lectin-domain containing receptor kinase II-2 [Nymphaea thermarum]|nr:putative L-type lectin-domain containing receptor kinase II-2 [Nymphaea thermarum]